MPAEAVAQTIKSLLTDATPRSMVLKGRWGLGKTYLWNSLVREVAGDPNGGIRATSYVYVSLFGVGSIDELKNLIFQQRLDPRDISQGTSLSSLISSARGVLPKALTEVNNTALDRWRIFRQVEASLKGIGDRTKISDAWKIAGSLMNESKFGALYKQLTFASVENFVICLDDIERRGKLELNDLLGLICYLRDDRDCRVLTILNDDMLGEDRSVLERYREKCFDLEIQFTSTVEFAAGIGLPRPVCPL